MFVDGCFWHGHDCPRRILSPRTNVAFWKSEIDGDGKTRPCGELSSSSARMDGNTSVGVPVEGAPVRLCGPHPRSPVFSPSGQRTGLDLLPPSAMLSAHSASGHLSLANACEASANRAIQAVGHVPEGRLKSRRSATAAGLVGWSSCNLPPSSELLGYFRMPPTGQRSAAPRVAAAATPGAEAENSRKREGVSRRKRLRNPCEVDQTGAVRKPRVVAATTLAETLDRPCRDGSD